MRAGWLLVAASTLTAALSASMAARADDTSAPVIVFTPPTSAAKGAFTVTAKITDESKFYPQIFVRYAGGAYQKALDLKKGKLKDTYEVSIPYKTEKLEYYLECYDELGNGPARAGDPDHPFKVSLGDGSAPNAPSPTVVASAPIAPSAPMVLSAPIAASAPKPAAPSPAPSIRSLPATPAPAAAASARAAAPASASTSARAATGGSGRVWTWVAGGAGLGLLTGGLLAGLAVKAQLESNQSLGLKATLLTIGGGVLLGAAVGLFFLEAPRNAAATPPPGRLGRLGGDGAFGQSEGAAADHQLTLGASPVDGGAAAVVAGRF